MTSSICPYLGLIDDAETNATFPYEGNGCHRVKPPVLISLTYQQASCLSPAHTNCPGFVNGWEKGFPKALRGEKPRWQKSIPKIFLLSAVLLLVSGFFLASFSGIFPWEGLNFVNDVVQAWQNTPTPTMTLPPTRTSTPAPTDIPTSQAGTATASPTHTVTKTRITIETRTSTETLTPTITETLTRTFAPIIVPTETARPAPPVNPPTATTAPKPTKVPPSNTPLPTATHTSTSDVRP